MTTAKTSTPTLARGASDTRQMPDWDNFIPPIPELTEDAMLQEAPYLRIFSILDEHFQNSPDVLVSGGWGFIYYDRYDMNAKRAPDCTIAFGVDAEQIVDRNAYMIWEVGKPPDVAIEIASSSTAVNDIGVKREIYAEIGIGEYWLLDRTGGDLYGAPLIGERLVDGEYIRYPTYMDDQGRIASHSDALNMDFHWDGSRFGIYDPVAGEDMVDLREAKPALRETNSALADANQTIETEQQARQAAEQSLQSERQARQAERQARLAEQRARQDAEAEIRRLREELDRRQ